MKKIFIVKGISNCGKSTIINQVIDWVLQNYTNQNTIQFEPKKKPENEFDRFGIIQINKLKIGFISEGDTYDHVKMRLKQFDELNCDIIVCASRTRESSYKAVWEFLNLHNLTRLTYLHRFIDVYFPANDAQTILAVKEIQTWLTGLEKL